MPAVRSAVVAASDKYCALPGTAIWPSELAKIAAVPEFSGHDEVPRRTKYGEGDGHQEAGVEAADQRRSSDARIAQQLGNIH